MSAFKSMCVGAGWTLFALFLATAAGICAGLYEQYRYTGSCQTVASKYSTESITIGSSCFIKVGSQQVRVDPATESVFIPIKELFK